MATCEKHLSLENLHIQSIVSRLDEDERILRLALQNCILSAGSTIRGVIILKNDMGALCRV